VVELALLTMVATAMVACALMSRKEEAREGVRGPVECSGRLSLSSTRALGTQQGIKESGGVLPLHGSHVLYMRHCVKQVAAWLWTRSSPFLAYSVWVRILALETMLLLHECSSTFIKSNGPLEL
jgi:hypothetical protein